MERKRVHNGCFVVFVCLGFYAVSTVFQLFNSDSSQIHVSWTIPIILSAKGEATTTTFKDFGLSRGSNLRPVAHDAYTVSSRPPWGS